MLSCGIGILLALSGIDSLAISDKEKDLPEVVVSVNRVEQNRLDLPQEVVSITEKQIERGNMATSADVLQTGGQVFVQKSQQGGGSPVLRGFEASRIQLVIDDVRMNNLIYRSGHLQNVVTIDPAALSRIEVVNGPSSTIYGSDALGGVIHLRTKQPYFSPDSLETSGTAFLRYATATGEQTGHLQLHASGRRLASFSSVTFSDFGDVRMGKSPGSLDSVWGQRYFYADRIGDKDTLVRNNNEFVQRYSGYRQLDLLQRLTYRTERDVLHGLNVQYSTSSNIPRYDRLTDESSTGLRFSDWYYGPQQRFLAAYYYDRRLSRSFFDRVKAVISYQYLVESRHTRTFGSPTRINRTEYVNVAGYTVFLDRDQGNHAVRLGVDGQFSAVNSVAGTFNVATGAEGPQSTRYPDDANTMGNHAIYYSHSWKLNSELSLHDGLRLTYTSLYSRFSDTTFFSFPFSTVDQRNLTLCGNLGVVWRPNDSWKFSALGSTGFRAPNVDDLAKVFDSSPGVVIVPNPDLGPERVWSGELGVTAKLTEKIRWENSGYYSLFTNAIITDRYQYNGNDSIYFDGVYSAVYANQNQRRAYITGFTTSIEAEVTDCWHFVGMLAYTYGRILTDSGTTPLDHIPPFYGRVSLRYSAEEVEVELFSLFNGQKKIADYLLNGEDNEQYATPMGMPSWQTMNLRGSWSGWNPLTIQLGVDNILDINYRTFSSGIHAPGRNFILAARVIF